MNFQYSDAILKIRSWIIHRFSKSKFIIRLKTHLKKKDWDYIVKKYKLIFFSQKVCKHNTEIRKMQGFWLKRR
jgi:hypothetical protein